MDKNRWLDFLSARLKSQIALENFAKLQVWALGLLSLISFAFAFSVVNDTSRSISLFNTKSLYLILFHTLLLTIVYLPSQLQKGEKYFNRLLGIRDFTSLSLAVLALTLYAVITLMIAHQAAAGTKEMTVSGFFNTVAWANLLLSAGYVGGFLFYLFCFFVFPNLLIKAAERFSKNFFVPMAVHASFLLLWGLGYSELNQIGSPAFFEEFRLAASFWVGIAASILFVGKLLSASAVSAIASVELETAAGRLERGEDILARFKDAFVSRRLTFWINRLSHWVATQSHQIAQFTHEAMTLVGRDHPTELDLRQVEERYRRADGIFKKLEKEDQRFLLSASVFDLNDAEREKIEELRNQFSRELRHAKLELASVRKRIDDKLVAIKNSEHPAALATTPVPVEKVPVSR